MKPFRGVQSRRLRDESNRTTRRFWSRIGRSGHQSSFSTFILSLLLTRSYLFEWLASSGQSSCLLFRTKRSEFIASSNFAQLPLLSKVPNVEFFNYKSYVRYLSSVLTSIIIYVVFGNKSLIFNLNSSFESISKKIICIGFMLSFLKIFF